METPADTNHCTEKICALVGVRFLFERRDDMKKKKPNKNAQELPEWFWRQMMGQDRQTLKRGKGGALRRK